MDQTKLKMQTIKTYMHTKDFQFVTNMTTNQKYFIRMVKETKHAKLTVVINKKHKTRQLRVKYCNKYLRLVQKSQFSY